MKFILLVALFAFCFAHGADCGNSMVLELQDEYVTSLDFAIQTMEAPKGTCKDLLICEFQCTECLADPFVFDVTTTSLKNSYEKVCTNQKQALVKQIIHDQMKELKLLAVQEKTQERAVGPMDLTKNAQEDKKDNAFFEATQKELTTFAETVKRLCDDRVIPRAMPVQVINTLWDRYMAESVTIRGFLENLEKEVNIGQTITLDEVKRVGYGVLNKVVDEYTRPCLCKKVVEEAHKWGGDPIEIAGFKIRDAVIQGQCKLREKLKCMFGGGMMTVPTPWGTITVNLKHGVVANRDAQGGAVDIDQMTGQTVWSQDNRGNGGAGAGHNGGNGGHNRGDGNKTKGNRKGGKNAIGGKGRGGKNGGGKGGKKGVKQPFNRKNGNNAGKKPSSKKGGNPSKSNKPSKGNNPSKPQAPKPAGKSGGGRGPKLSR